MLERTKTALLHCMAAALAAALAYWFARMVFGHSQPVFAAIAALICLAPNIPDHIKQGGNLLLGMTIGIVIGELALFFPYEMGEVRFAAATFAAMLIAASLSAAPVVPIQAGASALLVQLLGPQYAGLSRFIDAASGVVIALILAFIIFHPSMKTLVGRLRGRR